MFRTLARLYNIQALRGPTTHLFEGRTTLSGYNVPHSKHKTKRKWKPNVHTKRLFSESLGGTVKVRLTASTLRTIDKYGGLDSYMLRNKNLHEFERMGGSAMALRIRIREAEKEKVDKALAEEMHKMGLS
ncbi:hypothetical protein DACRYDRAFT_22510 [Dacryopinax primogenitus]|uniref:Large ribosomal subunit protein bL28c n=1 Tax=Dacryopinax primogenitus (strain DJM 731) TaxID=1858805 RepID=M5GBF8_DACPD|nr:uncharacterized protein DACRYDRAFT_22510 [Dacryopinax primogenitus]EJU01338.1 hypothetical protein DACRYDRAFT_22510 [Dacryopinax primogenitus]